MQAEEGTWSRSRSFHRMNQSSSRQMAARVKSNSNSKWKQVTMSKYSIARNGWGMQEAGLSLCDMV